MEVKGCSFHLSSRRAQAMRIVRLLRFFRCSGSGCRWYKGSFGSQFCPAPLSSYPPLSSDTITTSVPCHPVTFASPYSTSSRCRSPSNKYMPHVDPPYPSFTRVVLTMSALPSSLSYSSRLPSYRASHVGRFHPYPRGPRRLREDIYIVRRTSSPSSFTTS